MIRALLVAVAATLFAATVAAEPNYPALTAPVVDQAGILGAEIAQIDQKLRSIEQSSGHQVAVATVRSLEGYEIRQYGNELFRKWALGDAKRDDGVLILVAPNERKVAIEVGYGLEGDLTDAISRIIIENAIIPRFKAGDYAGGVNAGIDDVAKVIGGKTDEVLKRVQNQGAPTFEEILPFIIFFLIVVFILSNGSRGRRVVIIPGGGYGGGGWHSSGGGWSGGGGGGGWSGGGGSSGGGGASGSW